jgi:hypothetical protein
MKEQFFSAEIQQRQLKINMSKKQVLSERFFSPSEGLIRD